MRAGRFCLNLSEEFGENGRIKIEYGRMRERNVISGYRMDKGQRYSGQLVVCKFQSVG